MNCIKDGKLTGDSCYGCEVKAKECGMLELLEKQRPKKPNLINSQNVCPDRDCLEKVLRFYNNCHQCGQKIDWSVE